MALPRNPLILLIPLALLLVVLGCSSPAPTPTPEPTATATPIPPTPTFTPTPTATPTPTPSLSSVVAQLRASVVKVTAGDVQLSGVALANPPNHVLTTSVSLGAGPLVTVRTDSGQTFQGWIVGRDDTANLALVRVIGGTIPGVQFGNSSGVAVGAQVVSIGYPVARPGATPIEGTVTAVRTDFATGVRFLRVDAPPVAGSMGGAVFNRSGQFLAMNVESSYIQSLGMSAGDETFAKAEDTIQLAVPGLTAGAWSMKARPMPQGNSGSPPPTPLIIKGKAVTTGSAVVPSGVRVFGRLFASGLADLWYVSDVEQGGTFSMTIGVLDPAYASGKIELYYDGVKSGTVLNYQAGQVVEQTFSFP